MVYAKRNDTSARPRIQILQVPVKGPVSIIWPAGPRRLHSEISSVDYFLGITISLSNSIYLPGNPVRLFTGCLTIFVLTCSHLSSAQQVSPHAQKAVETIRQLRAIPLPESDQLQAGPPPRVPGLLRQLNQELKALIVEDLNDRSKHAVPDEEEILDQLRAAGWDEIPTHKWNAYGEIRQIKFDWKLGYEPGLLVVSTQLWIPCGNADPDSAVYVFQGIGRKWQLVLTANPDFDPAGAEDETGMQYGLSPPDSRGQWFMAVAHLPPSCRGDRSTLRFKVLRPSVNSDKPDVILAQRDKINPHFDPAFRVDVETDWFAITEGTIRKLDGEPGIRVLRYQLSGNQTRRIAPLALIPEDFLDQWVQLNWDQASNWAGAATDTALQEWHAKLSSLETDSVEIESTHLCQTVKNGDEKWVVELWIDQELNSSMKQERLFVEVAKRNGTFYVDSVFDAAPPGCRGKTPHNPLTELSLPLWHNSVQY
jgi:hypothetical protein